MYSSTFLHITFKERAKTIDLALHGLDPRSWTDIPHNPHSTTPKGCTANVTVTKDTHKVSQSMCYLDNRYKTFFAFDKMLTLGAAWLNFTDSVLTKW